MERRGKEEWRQGGRKNGGKGEGWMDERGGWMGGWKWEEEERGRMDGWKGEEGREGQAMVWGRPSSLFVGGGGGPSSCMPVTIGGLVCMHTMHTTRAGGGSLSIHGQLCVLVVIGMGDVGHSSLLMGWCYGVHPHSCRWWL